MQLQSTVSHALVMLVAGSVRVYMVGDLCINDLQSKALVASLFFSALEEKRNVLNLGKLKGTMVSVKQQTVEVALALTTIPLPSTSLLPNSLESPAVCDSDLGSWQPPRLSSPPLRKMSRQRRLLRYTYQSKYFTWQHSSI